MTAEKLVEDVALAMKNVGDGSPAITDRQIQAAIKVCMEAAARVAGSHDKREIVSEFARGYYQAAYNIASELRALSGEQ